ncbi:unnamed protein product [Arabidopsis halleri]
MCNVVSLIYKEIYLCVKKKKKKLLIYDNTWSLGQ